MISTTLSLLAALAHPSLQTYEARATPPLASSKLDQVSSSVSLFCLKARIGGRERTMLLDTGSAFTLVQSTKEAASGSIREEEVRIGEALTRLPVRFEKIAILKIVNAQRASDPVQGILGMDYLRRFSCGIDVPAGVLALWAKGASASVASFWFRNAFITDPSSPTRWVRRGSDLLLPSGRLIRSAQGGASRKILSIGVRTDVDGRLEFPVTSDGSKWVSAVLDTGSMYTTMSDDSISELGSFESKQIGTISGYGWQENSRLAKVPMLRTSDLILTPPHGVVTSKNARDVVGLDALVRRCIFFDADSSTLMFLDDAEASAVRSVIVKLPDRNVEVFPGESLILGDYLWIDALESGYTITRQGEATVITAKTR